MPLFGEESSYCFKRAQSPSWIHLSISLWKRILELKQKGQTILWLQGQVNTHWVWGARKRKTTSLPLGKGPKKKNHPGLRQFMVSHCCERHMVSEKDPPPRQDDGLHRARIRLVEPLQPDQVSRNKKEKSPAREQKEQEWDPLYGTGPGGRTGTLRKH